MASALSRPATDTRCHSLPSFSPLAEGTGLRAQRGWAQPRKVEGVWVPERPVNTGVKLLRNLNGALLHTAMQNGDYFYTTRISLIPALRCLEQGRLQHPRSQVASGKNTALEARNPVRRLANATCINTEGAPRLQLWDEAGTQTPAFIGRD